MNYCDLGIKIYTGVCKFNMTCLFGFSLTYLSGIYFIFFSICKHGCLAKISMVELLN